VLPDLTENGHLPVGRWPATFDELYEAFVTHPRFAGSETRRQVWAGLTVYLRRWETFRQRLNHLLGEETLIKCLWLGGSFISGKINPHNLDLTVIVNGDFLGTCQGTPGLHINSTIRDLTNRNKIEPELGVTPTLVRYRYVGSLFRAANWSDQQKDYLMRRGMWDDWWLRTRPEGEDKGPPTVQTGGWKRGYVEVTP
jgi:hypothetical protein